MKRPDALRAELSGSDRCTSEGLTAHGSAPTIQLCRELLAQGVNPDRALHVFRNGTLALRIRAIGEGARLEINAEGNGFRRARQPDAASLMRQMELDVSGIGSTASATSEAVP